MINGQHTDIEQKHLLGQLCVLQSSVDISSPGHSAPPKNGPVQFLYLQRVPPPHVTLHELQDPQLSQTPSTTNDHQITLDMSNIVSLK